ncbi:MAG: hypothetical protein HQK53_05865 [Oligoflexia bacterium]|nr:hypothetical protein [Oligoflexia bacterium]
MHSKVVIFGADIAGLSVAYELGYIVSVHEAIDRSAGFFRSIRSIPDNTPFEYSWPDVKYWYLNSFNFIFPLVLFFSNNLMTDKFIKKSSWMKLEETII